MAASASPPVSTNAPDFSQIQSKRLEQFESLLKEIDAGLTAATSQPAALAAAPQEYMRAPAHLIRKEPFLGFSQPMTVHLKTIQAEIDGYKILPSQYIFVPDTKLTHENMTLFFQFIHEKHPVEAASKKQDTDNTAYLLTLGMILSPHRWAQGAELTTEKDLKKYLIQAVAAFQQVFCTEENGKLLADFPLLHLIAKELTSERPDNIFDVCAEIATFLGLNLDEFKNAGKATTDLKDAKQDNERWAIVLAMLSLYSKSDETRTIIGAFTQKVQSSTTKQGWNTPVWQELLALTGAKEAEGKPKNVIKMLDWLTIAYVEQRE
jgi:hypothetical protein